MAQNQDTEHNAWNVTHDDDDDDDDELMLNTEITNNHISSGLI
jgi:hypothetical protein